MGRSRVLAVHGGIPEVCYDFKKYNTLGEEEKTAALEVLKSGVLSDFLGKYHTKFFGGKNVRELEENWSKLFGIKYSVSYNSATSALCAAIGACNIGTGDEVIVSPYTMSATATAILNYNAVPVFADICSKTFNITPESILKNITPYTKAVVVPSIIGHPAKLDEIIKIARKNNLLVIEDACQAPYATLNDKFVGTFGDVGVFSLNKHKHIQTGEGGIAVTDNPEILNKLQLIRNHGEVATDTLDADDLVNTFGFNYRMGEIEAAIAKEQLKKIKSLVDKRIEVANHLTSRLNSLDSFIDTPFVAKNSKHVYYLYAIKYKHTYGMPHRDRIVEAICAEGVPVRCGFQKPLYLFKMYQERVAYAGRQCSVWGPLYEGNVSYEKGTCPVAERLENDEMITFHIEHLDLTMENVQDVYSAFKKVFDNIHTL